MSRTSVGALGLPGTGTTTLRSIEMVANLFCSTAGVPRPSIGECRRLTIAVAYFVVRVTRATAKKTHELAKGRDALADVMIYAKKGDAASPRPNSP